MKLLLFVVISCLALHNGKGAPRTAVYKFLRCNPEGDQANCVTQQSPEMAWSPELPAKLPSSTAQYLEAEPVEDEKPDREGEEEDEVELEVEDETPMLGEEGESPAVYFYEEASGAYEGSAYEGSFMADKAIESGSGASSTDKYFGLQKGESRGMRRLFGSRFLVGEAKPEEQELKEDHLLV
ncbi:serglycin [Notolabrus celidotus]|uniref:serglycin n=1 Tax=Notolabrus celidotus TaxID=1203425 RepID=UPI00148F6D3C|nr:serglycin [Notolabrus celidotus]